MAQTVKGRKKQLKTQAEASSKEMGNVFEDLSKRMNAQFKKDASKAAKAWGDAAKGAAAAWYDVEEASKKIGTSEFTNLNYSAQIVQKKKEMWQLDNEMSDLTKVQVAEKKEILEQDIEDYEVLQKKAVLQNKEHEILSRGNALIEGLEKKYTISLPQPVGK